MKSLTIFLFEWKHFLRNPFKVFALLLFILAGVYGLHNGASLYEKQTSEIEKINQKIEKDRNDIFTYYKEGEVGPKARPWVDVTTPFWAIWYSWSYHFKHPSPAMVYSIGQAEQYGFYKQVTFLSSPYDTDMAEEIANPERLQMGTLDFSFTILFLLPLLLLILVYNLKSYEQEQGFMSLILVQNSSKNNWLVSRLVFYACLVFFTIILLMIYGALLTNVLTIAPNVFGQITLLVFLYLLLWSFLYFLILRAGKNILGNALQMIGVYLVLTFVIPAATHQWISIEKPVNLMTDYIDGKRDKKQDLYDEPDSLLQAKLFKMFPEIKNSKIARDTLRNVRAMNSSISALTNQLMKESVQPIKEESIEKNEMIQSTYWFNPVVYFQNEFNLKSETHYQNYNQYREEIQKLIDKQIQIMVPDIYNDVKVNKKKYTEYIELLNYDK